MAPNPTAVKLCEKHREHTSERKNLSCFDFHNFETKQKKVINELLKSFVKCDSD